MVRRICLFSTVALFLYMPQLMAGADASMSAPRLTATQIIEKNVGARGGLTAWRSVKMLSMTGKMDAGGDSRPALPVPGGKKARAQMPPPRPTEQAQLPFTIELKRPRKTRVEIQFNGQTAIQAYDGTNGWKLRPFLNRHEIESFTPDELKLAALESDLDGPLIDYAAKGSKVELVGTELIEGRNCYNLKVTDKSSHTRHVWVDAENFLETKMEGNARRLDGRSHPVAIYFRDYRSVNGLMIPHLLETVVEGVKQKEKIQIETVALNPKLEDSLFERPR
jgi:outer membrane lipoprotein-sorting protein